MSKTGIDDQPNYDNNLIKLLVDAMDMNQLKTDFNFDWIKDMSYHSSCSKTNDSNIDSVNLSSIKNKNSNCYNSSIINKNDISQYLKMIMIEDNNSIRRR